MLPLLYECFIKNTSDSDRQFSSPGKPTWMLEYSMESLILVVIFFRRSVLPRASRRVGKEHGSTGGSLPRVSHPFSEALLPFDSGYAPLRSALYIYLAEWIVGDILPSKFDARARLRLPHLVRYFIYIGSRALEPHTRLCPFVLLWISFIILWLCALLWSPPVRRESSEKYKPRRAQLVAA